MSFLASLAAAATRPTMAVPVAAHVGSPAAVNDGGPREAPAVPSVPDRASQAADQPPSSGVAPAPVQGPVQPVPSHVDHHDEPSPARLPAAPQGADGNSERTSAAHPPEDAFAGDHTAPQSGTTDQPEAAEAAPRLPDAPGAWDGPPTGIPPAPAHVPIDAAPATPLAPVVHVVGAMSAPVGAIEPESVTPVEAAMPGAAPPAAERAPERYLRFEAPPAAPSLSIGSIDVLVVPAEPAVAPRPFAVAASDASTAARHHLRRF